MNTIHKKKALLNCNTQTICCVPCRCIHFTAFVAISCSQGRGTCMGMSVRPLQLVIVYMFLVCCPLRTRPPNVNVLCIAHMTYGTSHLWTTLYCACACSSSTVINCKLRWWINWLGEYKYLSASVKRTQTLLYFIGCFVIFFHSKSIFSRPFQWFVAYSCTHASWPCSC